MFTVGSNRGPLRPVLLGALAGILCLTAARPAPSAEPPVGERYQQAVALAAEGETGAALDALAALAETVPASVPVHRAIALTALAAGEDTVAAWNDTFQERLRRTRRDVGASVGRAILLAAEDRDREAHSLLTSAIFAGARHPLLVPVLLETSPNPAGLADWARRRARALGDDPDFEALRAHLLLAQGRTAEALEVVVRTLERHPQSGDLLALHARLAWASGEEETACEQAALAIGFLEDRTEVADVRVPRRAGLARALLACGRQGDAQTVLGNLGPLITPPGAPRLEPIDRALSAELLLARGRLVEAAATARLPSGTEAPAPWDETLRSLGVRARARAGLPVNAAALIEQPPHDHAFALADRALALAALAGAVPGTVDPPPGVEPLLRLSRSLLDHDLSVRGVRTALLAELVAEGGETQQPQLDDLLAIVGTDPSEAPVPLQAATRIVRVRRAFAARDGSGVLELSRVPAVEQAGAPGALLAPLRIARARAALAAGQADAAAKAVEEGLLDLQSADLEQRPLPGELVPFEGTFGTPALVLPDLAFRAALERGDSPEVATARLLEAMDRAARTWSILGLPGAREPRALTDRLPEGGCLIVAPPDPGRSPKGGLAARLSPGTPVAVGTPAELLAQAPCAGADVVYWLGPGRPPGSLTLSGEDAPLLVRWIGPRPPRSSAAAEGRSARDAAPGRVGSGPQRPFRQVVRSLAAPGDTPETGDPVEASRVRLYGWPIYTGTGLSLSASPLASGWLVPPGSPGEAGWMTPESIPPPPAAGLEAAPGLVALGLRAAPDAAGSERGPWLLAEAAVDAGWGWALLSKRPLGSEELARLDGEWEAWREDPLGAARSLADDAPELAGALSLWAAPGRLEPKPRLWPWLLGLGLAAVVAAGVLVLRPWRRLSRPGPGARSRPGRQARRDRPS